MPISRAQQNIEHLQALQQKLTPVQADEGLKKTTFGRTIIKKIEDGISRLENFFKAIFKQTPEDKGLREIKNQVKDLKADIEALGKDYAQKREVYIADSIGKIDIDGQYEHFLDGCRDQLLLMKEINREILLNIPKGRVRAVDEVTREIDGLIDSCARETEAIQQFKEGGGIIVKEDTAYKNVVEEDFGPEEQEEVPTAEAIREKFKSLPKAEQLERKELKVTAGSLEEAEEEEVGAGADDRRVAPEEAAARGAEIRSKPGKGRKKIRQKNKDELSKILTSLKKNVKQLNINKELKNRYLEQLDRSAKVIRKGKELFEKDIEAAHVVINTIYDNAKVPVPKDITEKLSALERKLAI